MSRLPDGAAPLAPVSVIVVSHGAAAWTERTLRALAAHTPEPHELILVDNGSGPAAVARLATLAPRALLVRNAGNVGFGPGVNQGAERARGRHLVLLNSDALVRPGWLEPLLARAERPGVGAVAPMLLNLDGSVQEAGAVVWGDGVTSAVGAGARPDAPELAFPRAVDYASAACLLVRRDAFLAVGGLDPVYAPGYYEDADLCLALAARGWRTEYAPAARVVHAGGASGAGAAALALVARNRPVFRRRFAAALEGRPRVPDPRDRAATLAGRDLIAGARILLLADAVPGRNAPPGRLASGLRAGWPGARLTLLAATPGAAGDRAALRADGVEVLVASGPAAGAERIAERRDHYELAVLAGRGRSVRGWARELGRTQRRAHRLAGPGATDLAGAAGDARRRAAELAALALADAVLASADREGSFARAFAGARPVWALERARAGALPPRGLVAALAGAGVEPPA